MILKVKRQSDLNYSDATPEPIYRSRREFLATAAASAVGFAAAPSLAAQTPPRGLGNLAALASTRNAQFVATDKVNSYNDIATYNNYYEFGTEKSDPAENAHTLKVAPWTVKVDGLVAKPGNYGIENLIDFKALEERVYRHRCVERWSMVIPWIGVPLSSLIKKLEPMPSAKFVEFTTLLRPEEMPGQKTSVLTWPYVEGLRMDEAMHPLTLAVVGLYGKVLPNQNGAPLRIHIPWKYGFKSGKSIVRFRFTDKQPVNTWQVSAPHEYGFYANVNPSVPHPRWSQAREQRLPGILPIPTQLFNGYGEQVASLYTGLDLKANY